MKKEQSLKLNNQLGTVVYSGVIKTGLVTYNKKSNGYNVKGCSNMLFSINEIFGFFEMYALMKPTPTVDEIVKELNKETNQKWEYYDKGSFFGFQVKNSTTFIELDSVSFGTHNLKISGKIAHKITTFFMNRSDEE